MLGHRSCRTSSGSADQAQPTCMCCTFATRSTPGVSSQHSPRFQSTPLAEIRYRLSVNSGSRPLLPRTPFVTRADCIRWQRSLRRS